MTLPKLDPKRDLVLERVVDVVPELVWKAWTRPEHIVKWFTPRPWETIDCRMDLRPGGEFFTMMRSPEGEEYPNSGCYLEIVEGRKLAWTETMEPGFRPKPATPEGLPMTAIVLIEPEGTGTKYTAIALHPDETSRMRHEEMGFHDGWGTALDQLVAYAKTLA